MQNDINHNMKNALKSTGGLQRISRALGYSIAGLKAAYEHEFAIKQEVFLALFFVPLGFYLGQTNIERIMLVGAVLAVFIVELLNSAIETAIDHTSLDLHPLAGRAKDIGSAAVLIALVLFGLVWLMILFG
jgi:diacylglycerol kinase (ATP)